MIRVRQGFKAILVSGAALVSIGVAPLHAQDPQSEGVHVVRDGDTLWELADQYLRDPFSWPRIYGLNRDVVADPHWIFPTERLRIPGLAQPLGEPVSNPLTQPVVFSQEPARTVFFREERTVAPVGPTIREGEEIAVSMVKPGDFYRAPLLTPAEAVRPIGRVAELLAPSVVPIKIAPQIGIYDKIFITLAGANAAAEGDLLHMLRPGRRIDEHGYVFLPTGIARVESIERGIATALVIEMYDAVAVGDVVVPMPEFSARPGVVPQQSGGLDANLIAFKTVHPIHMVGDVAFIDRGAASGVQPGDEFVAYIPPTQMDWGIRPAIDVATLLVVRVTPGTAAVRVTGLEQPALEAGLPARLVRKMP